MSALRATGALADNPCDRDECELVGTVGNKGPAGRIGHWVIGVCASKEHRAKAKAQIEAGTDEEATFLPFTADGEWAPR
jgi:hypothetical protein